LEKIGGKGRTDGGGAPLRNDYPQEQVTWTLQRRYQSRDTCLFGE